MSFVPTQRCATCQHWIGGAAVNDRTFLRRLGLVLRWSTVDVQCLKTNVGNNLTARQEEERHHEGKKISKQYLKTTVGGNQY